MSKRNLVMVGLANVFTIVFLSFVSSFSGLLSDKKENSEKTRIEKIFSWTSALLVFVGVIALFFISGLMASPVLPPFFLLVYAIMFFGTLFLLLVVFYGALAYKNKVMEFVLLFHLIFMTLTVIMFVTLGFLS